MESDTNTKDKRKFVINNVINNSMIQAQSKKLSELKPFVEYASKNKNVILESVKKYGTPQYLLDEKLFLENLNNLKSNFKKTIPKSRLFYAFKSNDLPYILTLLKNNDVNADVSCMFEIQLALKLGFKNIIYTAPYKSDDEIRLAIKNDVVLNIDNNDELQKIILICQKDNINAKVSFRIRNVGKSWIKFGVDIDSFVDMAKKTMKNPRLTWVGVHFHSSWNVDSQLYESNLKMVSLCLKNNFTHKELSDLKFIDIGGGLMPFESISINEDFKMPSNIKKFAENIGKAIKNLIIDKLDIDPEIWLEPGRMICSTSTMILLKIDSIKNNEFITDGGINMLGDSVFEEEYYPVINISKPSTKLNNGKINGPLCDPSDHWGNWYFGEKLTKGDIVAVMNQGAYTFSTAWRWQRPISKYVSFNNSNLKLVKSEETFEERYSGCKF